MRHSVVLTIRNEELMSHSLGDDQQAVQYS